MKRRLFFGLPLSENSRPALEKYIQTLRPVFSSSKITWVKPEVLHVTLRFLGEVSETMVEKLSGWETALGPLRVPQVILGPLGTFPHGVDGGLDLKHPKVLFLHVEPPEPVIAIYRRLEETLAGCGFAPEDRRYLPHLTIGRVKYFKPDRNAGSGLPPFFSQPERLRTLTLYESQLTSAGPVHTPVSSMRID